MRTLFTQLVSLILFFQVVNLGVNTNSAHARSIETAVDSSKTYYWVPFGDQNRGSGSWNDLNHWATTSGGTTKHETLPTAADNVIFDLNSFKFSGQTVLINTEASVKNIEWVNIRAATLNISGGILNVHGSLQAHSNLTFASTKIFNLNFKSANQETPINLANKALPVNSYINFDGTGSWILNSALTTGLGSQISILKGTLHTNNYPVVVNTFSSYGNSARGLNLGTSTVSGLSIWELSSSLALEATEARIIMNGPGSHIFNGGGKTYRVVQFYGPESYIFNSNTFKELSITNPAGATTNSLILESGQVQTIESLFPSASEPYTTIQSSYPSSTAGIKFTSFRLCTDNLTLSDVTATGPGSYYAGQNGKGIGNTKGWEFVNCGVSVYSPKSAADYSNCMQTVTFTSTGDNKWQPIIYNNELVAAVNDGGNALGNVTIQFAVDSSNARSMVGSDGSDISLTTRNWAIKADSAINAANPISIRFYGLQKEMEAYQSLVPQTAANNGLVFTNYRPIDSPGNCDFTDNLEETAIISLISDIKFSTAGNYYTAELTGITTLGEYYLHNGNTTIDFAASIKKPEPVIEIVEMDFTGHRNAKTIKLKWKTAAEENVAYYEVEKATGSDSKEFTLVERTSQKNSENAAVAVYHAEDFNPIAGPNYYRLKRVALDGTYVYSQTILVENKPDAALVQASPNPFADRLTIGVTAEKAGNLSVKLITEYGKLALEKNLKVNKGYSEQDLPLTDKVTSGMYILVTELNGEVTRTRIVKQ